MDVNEIIRELDELIPEIYENALLHGWWNKETTIGEIYSLLHSELSEALEEYRLSRPIYYFVGRYGIQMEEFFETDKEPHGAAVEIADYVIRILSYFGHKGWLLTEALPDVRYADAVKRAERARKDLPSFIAGLHYGTSCAYEAADCNSVEIEKRLLTACVMLIAYWLLEHNIDLTAVCRVKHRYNITRPYRHGGKVI